MSALVGRAPELATLGSLLATAGQGRGGAAVVLGEPGIGKTALVEALAATATGQQVRVAWGRCTETDAPAFWPWRQALRALGAAVRVDGAATSSRPELFAQVVDELAGIEAPVLLVLEDIHWADPASLALLRFVADAAPGLPLLLVATARDEPPEAGPELTELLRSLPAGVPRLALAGLDQAAVAEVVTLVLGRPPAPELADRIADRCGGNPFFVREVARLHASRGPDATPAVPLGVQQVLERRLARLGRSCRDLLSVAAVAGEPDPQLLAELVAAPVATVLHDLSEAVTARLLHADGQRFRFAHALVRETGYALLPPAARADLHRRLAQALVVRAADPARLAGHWRRATGADAPATAAGYALAAARAAREELGYEQAVRFYQWALELPPEDDLVIRIELGEAQVLAGALAAGRETLTQAAWQAQATGRPRELARAVLGAGVGGFEVAMHDHEQVALLEQALAGLAHDDDQRGLRAAVLARLSVASAGQRTPDQRAALAEQAIPLARAAGDAPTEVAALAAWCDARAGPDYTAPRLARADTMLELAGRAGDPASLLLARRLRLVALAELGDFAGVDVEIAAYAQIAGRLRLPLYGWLVPIWRGTRALLAGDLAGTRRHHAEAEQLAAQAGSRNAEMLVLSLWGWLQLSIDDRAALGAAVDRLVDVAGGSRGNRLDESVAGLLAAAGRLDDVRSLLHRRQPLTAKEKDSEYLGELWFIGEAALAVADHEVIEEVSELLAPYAGCWVIDGIFSGVIGLVAYQLGRLAAARGRPDPARAWLAQARDAYRSAGAPLLLDWTERALAALPDAPARAVPTPGMARPGEPAEPAEFRRAGRVWTLRWEGAAVTVPDSKGMRDLAGLLAMAEREVPVLELVEAAGGPPAAAAGGHAGERLDRTARAAYRQRLAELADELAEAEANADAGRIEALRREQELLAAELAGAVGLGGRARHDGDPVERARKAVAMRIRTALKAIAEVHPALARHLDRSVTTGRMCAYRPERPVRWQLG